MSNSTVEVNLCSARALLAISLICSSAAFALRSVIENYHNIVQVRLLNNKF